MLTEPESQEHFPIVRIESKKSGGKCTAFVINDKQAVTAAHCVDEEVTLFDLFPEKDKFIVFNSKGVKTKTIAEVETVMDVDIAILKGDFKGFQKLPIERGFNLYHNQPLLACGYPGGFKELSCTNGVYKNTVYFSGAMTNVLAKGMSGGPVINAYGNVVGVNNSVRVGYSLFAMLFGNILPME